LFADHARLVDRIDQFVSALPLIAILVRNSVIAAVSLSAMLVGVSWLLILRLFRRRIFDLRQVGASLSNSRGRENTSLDQLGRPFIKRASLLECKFAIDWFV
jgi:hypothetical protein